MPYPISTGGVVPEEPPARMVGPRGGPAMLSYGSGRAGGFRPARPGSGAGLQVLEDLQAQEPQPVSLDSISAAGLMGRARANRLLDEAYEGRGGYDPKLAAIEEGGKDLALEQLDQEQELQAPTSAPRPAQRWRDLLMQEQADRGRQRLMEELGTIGGQQKELEDQLLGELMASPDYAAASPQVRAQMVARAQAAAQQHALDLERRYLAVGSLSAGKGLPTTAFPRQ